MAVKFRHKETGLFWCRAKGRSPSRNEYYEWHLYTKGHLILLHNFWLCSLFYIGKWIIRYKHPKDNISLHFVMNKSLIQAAYEILCWYMEKEYLKLIKPYVVNES